ncbi:hypothetical protein LJC01_01005 [Clostridiaceae bacterium OttesenSCG-928-D20]|nr:hypothetical protein [Clostridiaceae bacterium OttesenSCG-928-D20]
MNKFFLLIKNQLLGYLGVNKAIHSNDQKEKNKLTLMIISFVILGIYMVVMSATFSVGIAKTVESIGFLSYDLILIMFMFSSVMLTFVMGIYSSGNFLFKYKDYDMIMSLPIPTATIAMSRIAFLYIFDMLYTIILMLPAGIVYGRYTSSGAGFYLVYIILMFFIPLVPIIISSFLGVIVTVASNKFKRIGNLVNIILSFAMIGGIMLFSMSSTSGEEMVSIETLGILDKAASIYPLTRMFVNAAARQDVLSIVLFLFISIALFFAFCYLLATKYRSICSRTMSVGGGKARKLRGSDIQTRSVYKSLFNRELKRYTSSSIYVMNTAVGLVMSIAMAIFFSFKKDMFSGMQQGVDGVEMFSRMAPFFLSMFIGMSSTTGASISMEGKNLWILKVLPIDITKVFSAKIMLNLMLTIPTSLICSSIIAIAFKMSGIWLLFIYIIPLSISTLTAISGLLINLRFPKLEWNSEQEAVKQSLSIMLSMIVPMLFSMLAMILSIALGQIVAIIFTCLMLVLIPLSFLLLKKVGEKLFWNL